MERIVIVTDYNNNLVCNKKKTDKCITIGSIDRYQLTYAQLTIIILMIFIYFQYNIIRGDPFRVRIHRLFQKTH